MFPTLIAAVTSGLSDVLEMVVALPVAGFLILHLADMRVLRWATNIPVPRAPETKQRQRLWSFAHAATRSGPLRRRLPRVQTVEVSEIVGSVGRVNELAADFRPPRRARRPLDEERLERVRRAIQRGQHLSAIDLYQIGENYYVLDGHHRVAAAILLGQLAIEANVVEFVPQTAAII